MDEIIHLQFVKTTKFIVGDGIIHGQLGFGNDIFINRTKHVEFKIEGNSSSNKQIICEQFNTFAICQNNKIYCWGYNDFGQLGFGDNELKLNLLNFQMEKKNGNFLQKKTIN